MHHRFVVAALALLCSYSSAFAQMADFSVKFSDFGIAAKTIYFTEYSTFADETWYFGQCSNQYGIADLTLKATDYSTFADLSVHPTEYSTFADRVVCIMGDAPDQLIEALR